MEDSRLMVELNTNYQWNSKYAGSHGEEKAWRHAK